APPGAPRALRTPTSLPSRRCSRADNPTSSSPPRVVLHRCLHRGEEGGVRVGHFPHEAPRHEIEVAPCPLVAGPHIRHVEAILPVLRPATEAKPGHRAGITNDDLGGRDDFVLHRRLRLTPCLTK